jgi:hypothetical protein
MIGYLMFFGSSEAPCDTMVNGFYRLTYKEGSNIVAENLYTVYTKPFFGA